MTVLYDASKKRSEEFMNALSDSIEHVMQPFKPGAITAYAKNYFVRGHIIEVSVEHLRCQTFSIQIDPYAGRSYPNEMVESFIPDIVDQIKEFYQTFYTQPDDHICLGEG